MLFRVILNGLSHLVLKESGCSLNCPDGVRKKECSAITKVPSNQSEYISGRGLFVIKEGKKKKKKRTFSVISESEFLGIGPPSSLCTLHDSFFPS